MVHPVSCLCTVRRPSHTSHSPTRGTSAPRPRLTSPSHPSAFRTQLFDRHPIACPVHKPSQYLRTTILRGTLCMNMLSRARRSTLLSTLLAPHLPPHTWHSSSRSTRLCAGNLQRRRSPHRHASRRRTSHTATRQLTPPRVTAAPIGSAGLPCCTSTGRQWTGRSTRPTRSGWVGRGAPSGWSAWPRKSNTAAPRCCRSPSASRAAVAETAWAGGARRRVGRRARLREARRRLAESAPAPPLHQPARGSPRAPEVRRA